MRGGVEDNKEEKHAEYDEDGALSKGFGGSGLPTNAYYNDEEHGYTLDAQHPENNLCCPSGASEPPSTKARTMGAVDEPGPPKLKLVISLCHSLLTGAV